MTSTIRITSILLLVGVAAVSWSTAAYSANECRIQYGYNTGSALNGTYKNHSKKIYLNKGQTKTINKNRINYVKNLKTRNDKFYLNNVSNVVLPKNIRSPASSYFSGAIVKLVKVKCLPSSSSCNATFPKMILTPPGVPIPYPNIACK